MSEWGLCLGLVIGCVLWATGGFRLIDRGFDWLYMRGVLK